MKKFVLIAITAVMVLTLAYVPSVAAAQLSDIAGTQFEKQIASLVDAGVIAGFPDGTFKPDQEVTRAQFAKLVAVAMNLNSTGFTTSTFSDVAPDHWALGFIEAVAAKGWIQGYPDGTFGPEKNITREEMATLMIRVLGREEQAKKYTEAFVQANDCAKVSEWAFGAVTVAYHTDVQVLTRHDDMIDPQTPATRGETAFAVYMGMNPPKVRDSVLIAISQEPGTLYPYYNAMAAKSNVLNLVFDGVTMFLPVGPPDNQKVFCVPVFSQEVATLENGLVKINEDGTMDVSWVLRKTPIYWDDGTQVTWQDAVFNHEVIMNDAIPTESRDPDDKVVSMDISADGSTLKIKYSEETYFAGYGPVISLSKAKYGEMVATNPEGFFRGDVNVYPLASGAYNVSEWMRGTAITLKARDNYTFGPPNIKTVTFEYIPDVSTIFARAAAGTVDVTLPGLGATLSQVATNEQVIKDAGMTILYGPSVYVEHAEFNFTNWEGTPNPIFNDPNDQEGSRLLRRAIAFALNREEVAATIGMGRWLVGDSMIPPQSGAIVPTQEELGPDVVSYNPEMAKQLLDQAGWVVGSDGIRTKGGLRLEFTWSTTTRTDRVQLMQLFMKNLLDVGINVLPDVKPATVLFGDFTKKRQYTGMTFFAWGSNDPRNAPLSVYRGDKIPGPTQPDGQNQTGWKNDEFTAACKIVDESYDLPTAKAAALKCAQIMLHEMPAISCFFTTDAALFRSDLVNVNTLSPGEYLTWNVAYWYW